MTCPYCRSVKFYVKDAEDEYETYEFELDQGQIRFEDEENIECIPEVTDNCEIFCQKCAWHGPLLQVKKTGS